MLGVHDSHRMGGLRFRETENGDFLNNDQRLAAPPWTSLRDLEYAVQQYEKNADELDEASLKWINQQNTFCFGYDAASTNGWR